MILKQVVSPICFLQESSLHVWISVFKSDSPNNFRGDIDLHPRAVSAVHTDV